MLRSICLAMLLLLSPAAAADALEQHLSELIESSGIDAAVVDYRAQRASPSSPYRFDINQLNRLGYRLLQQQKPAQAIKLFQLNIEYYPDHWSIRDSLAEGYLQAGDYELSLKHYRLALGMLEQDKENASWGRKSVVGQMAKVYTKMGRPEAVPELYREEMASHPQSDWALQFVAEWNLRNGRVEEGVRQLIRATELQGSPDRAWTRLDEHYQAIGGEAYTRYLTNAKERFPYLASAWDRLAARLLQTGQREQVEAVIQQALQLYRADSLWRTAKSAAGKELIAAHRQDLQGQFSAMGCGPYRKQDETALTKYLQRENALNTSDFIVHLGDIVGYHGEVLESRFSHIADLLGTGNRIPTFIVLGDNEWNDSSDPAQSLLYWKRHLGDFHRRFKPSFKVSTQPQRQENFSFIDNRVVFLGINLPAGRVHDETEWKTRIADNAAWIRQNLDPARAKAAVILSQGPPTVFDGLLLETLKQAANRFTGPLLVLHADGHQWFYRSGEWAPNIIHVQTDKLHGNAPFYPPIQVRYTAREDLPFVFDRRIGAPAWQVE